MRRRGARGRCGNLGVLAGLVLAAAACASDGPDPWQPVNRPLFGFNEGVDRFVLEPVATGWDFVVPELVQTGIRNFFDNLSMPVVFANDLFQAKPLAAGQDLARFAVNTTVGVVGLFDVASRLDIPENDEDFGQTLGRWGTPSGPYFVIPLLGPSTVRDTLALPVDALLTPWWYFVPGWVTGASRGVQLVNTRAFYLEEVRENRETAFDYYVFVRDAWLQNRERRVSDRRPRAESEEDDDLYDIPEDESEDAVVPEEEPGELLSP